MTWVSVLPPIPILCKQSVPKAGRPLTRLPVAFPVAILQWRGANVLPWFRHGNSHNG